MFDRWFMYTIEQHQVQSGFEIEVLTDTFCHLWLRYTSVEPQKHRRFINRRGLFIPWDYRQCFVSYKDFEQNQDGDTLNHSFTWLDWHHCLNQWFYFWGTISSVSSPSTSPIFTKHYTDPPYPDSFLEYWDWWGVEPPSFPDSFIEYWSS